MWPAASCDVVLMQPTAPTCKHRGENLRRWTTCPSLSARDTAPRHRLFLTGSNPAHVPGVCSLSLQCRRSLAQRGALSSRSDPTDLSKFLRSSSPVHPAARRHRVTRLLLRLDTPSAIGAARRRHRSENAGCQNSHATDRGAEDLPYRSRSFGRMLAMRSSCQRDQNRMRVALAAYATHST